tara:strand:+ start:507 stop:746 length:240 start_codon:yes stop_codon:yes gene_type:complete
VKTRTNSQIQFRPEILDIEEIKNKWEKRKKENKLQHKEYVRNILLITMKYMLDSGKDCCKVPIDSYESTIRRLKNLELK